VPLASQAVDNTVDNRPRVNAREMLRLTGLTYRQIGHWSTGRVGILRPDEVDPGSGHPRTWPAEDVEVARCIAELMRQGLDLHVAARIARSPRDADGVVRVSLGPHVEVVVGRGAWRDLPHRESTYVTEVQ
jgi:DNA-binding transcriptional MerR regulator